MRLAQARFRGVGSSKRVGAGLARASVGTASVKMAQVNGSSVTVQRITTFREFAGTLAAQVVEQLCNEFEREVNVMYSDLVQYRNELGRVAEILGNQLGRERQLHEMLETQSAYQMNMSTQAQQAALQQPQSKSLHDLVDRYAVQQNQISATMLQGMSQARAVASHHATTAKQLEEPLINAENEFNRIMQLLSVPMISMATPQATTARTPAQAIQRSATPPASPHTGLVVQAAQAYWPEASTSLPIMPVSPSTRMAVLSPVGAPHMPPASPAQMAPASPTPPVSLKSAAVATVYTPGAS
mmetsp:Transcript_101772/g.287036  ORF Transcript_101772/g.287036 Transcript_101772/m.287036 type:complete len:299 (-) Transcript_101772:149-1045(-)